MSKQRWAWVVAAVAGVVLAGQLVLARHFYDGLPHPLLPPMKPVPPMASLSASTCAGCHPDFYAEWRRAPHGHGRAFSDPLYQADLRHGGGPYFCAYCHTPLVEQRKEVVSGLWAVWPRLWTRGVSAQGFESGITVEGVSCMACHQRGRALAGPHAIAAAPHAVQADGDFAGNHLCQPCHSLDIRVGTSFQRPIQDTFAEWQGYRDAGGDRRCVDCHMPAVGERALIPGGPRRSSRSHDVRGPWDVDFLRTGVVVRGAAVHAAGEGGAAATITLWNGTGHRLPTAEPQRRVEVALELLGADGAVLGRDVAVIQRLVDLEARRERAGVDTTLRPREERTFTLFARTPAPGVKAARLAVRFVLWEPDHKSARAAGLSRGDLVKTLHEQTYPLR